MFVKTPFNRIKNIAHCDEIKLDFAVKDEDPVTYCEIVAVFKDREERLLHFQASLGADRAQRIYDALFQALSKGENAFDITSFE